MPDVASEEWGLEVKRSHRKTDGQPFTRLYPITFARDAADAATDALDGATTMTEACRVWLQTYEGAIFEGTRRVR